MKKPKAYAGSYTLYRQTKPKNRWPSPDRPAHDPNWLVAFNIPTIGRQREMAKLYPLCNDCLEVVGNPVEERPNCDCIKRVRRWAEEKITATTQLLQQGEAERLKEFWQPKRVTPLSDVLQVYLRRGPDDARQRVNSLRSFYTQTTGGEFEVSRAFTGRRKQKDSDRALVTVETSMTWRDLTRNNFLDWAELRQEAGRRGWLSRNGKAMPADGWEQLRSLKAEGKLQVLDRGTVAKWNTTISQYLTNIKSIFGTESRQHELRGLVLPDLADFLETILDLPKPKGHKEIDAENWVAMLEAEDGLKAEDVRVWVVHELLLRLACRPIEVLWARPSWLQRLTYKDPQTGHERPRTRILIINRPDEGFTLKSGWDGKQRAIWLPDALVPVIERVATPQSLIGARHKTEAKDLIDAHSKWMRQFVPEESEQTNYLLRHSGAAERWTSESAGAASDLLGNSEKLIRTTYGRDFKTIEPVTDDEILRRVA